MLHGLQSWCCTVKSYQSLSDIFCHLIMEYQQFHPVLPSITDNPVLARTWLGLISHWCQTAGQVITSRNCSAVVNYEGHYLPSSRENGLFHFITQSNWVIVLPCNTEMVRKPFHALWISMEETWISALVQLCCP